MLKQWLMNCLIGVKMMRLTFDLNYYFEEELFHNDDEIKALSFQEKIAKMREVVFDFDYPIEKQYREQFEVAFLSHFWFKEIGFATFTRWHYQIQAHLLANGTRYNNLFKSQLEDIETAINMMDIETESTADSTSSSKLSGKGSNESKSESYSVNRSSDVPQGRTEIDGNYISGLGDAKQVSKTGSSSIS